MKKYGKYFAILSILAALSFAGCTAISSSGSLNEETKTAEQKNGNVTVKMLIPDYKALVENTAIAQSRAIAPQTKYARMKVKRPFSLGGGYFGNDVTVAIKDEDLTNVENAGDVGLPGKIWKAQFAVPAGTYSAGDIIVELIDSEKNVITSGSNSVPVTISEGASASCNFFTVPQSASNNKGSLALNEMKFFKVSYPVAGEKIRAVEADLGGAVIVRFNKDGTFGEVISGFTKDAEFNVTAANEGSYYGIWAKDAAVDSYSARLVLTKNIIDGSNPVVENFDSNLDLTVWRLYGHEVGDTVAPVPAKTEGQNYGTIYNPIIHIYEHEGTSTIRLGSLNRTVYVTKPSTVTFSFYPDIGYFSTETVSFSINGEEKGKWKGKGIRQTHTFALSEAGEYELNWSSPEGVCYLDCVSIVPDVTASAEITPKGMQTVVLGKEYTFTANALRSDGSVIEGKSVAEQKTFSTEGEQTFSMTVDGKTATTTVFVIKDVTSPVKYMGKLYNGIDSATVSGSVTNAGGKLAVNYPTGNVFSADGFFPLKLNVNNPEKHQFVYIKISKDSKSEDYVYRGNPTTADGELETRIWLRWGSGQYTVKVWDLASVSWADAGVDGTTSADGKVIYYGDNKIGATYSGTNVTFTVTNTRNEDGTWLYPSNYVQSDDIAVMNKAADLTAGLTTTKDKIKALHDFIVTSTVYDFDSFQIPGKRKRQDASAVLEYGMAVCEGYSNLSAALLRSLGVQIKIISSQAADHAWNNVNVGTADSPVWTLLDCTWDDPAIDGNKDAGSLFVIYDNFLLADLSGGSPGGTGAIGHTATDKIEMDY
ncbi:transglutaminase domain-containing protein [Treponema pectinovorum]|uniref:transglutaminase domain-containing protein n=1 Tax=Treponema pectinovorum TaxID=164 RepID=UPI0011C73665|nr:transglutaminase-like domain-containing protein [Treponema pectinovorum]